MRLALLALSTSLFAGGSVGLEWWTSAQDDDAARVSAILDDLRTNAALADNIALSVRSNLMGNYDPVVKAVDRLRGSMASLEGAAPRRDDLRALRAAIDARTDLIEHLKGEWAKQRNSSRFLLTWLGNPGGEDDAALAALLSAWLVAPEDEQTAAQLRAQLERTSASRIRTHITHVMESHRQLVEDTSLLLDQPLAPLAANVSRRHDDAAHAANAGFVLWRRVLACLTLLSALASLWLATRRAL